VTCVDCWPGVCSLLEEEEEEEGLFKEEEAREPEDADMPGTAEE